MSKTRTGRKGRARLAVAGYLNAGGLAATGADALDDAEIFNRMSAMAKGQGTGGELFSQGEVLGALPDAVDTDDRAPGIFANDSGDGSVIAAGVNGETSLAADADFPQLASPFPHYYLTAAGTSATSSKGIAYLPSGPAGNFVPANHGLAVDESVSIIIDVPQSELYAAGGAANLGLSVIGNLTGKSADADNPALQGVARDEVTGSFSQFRQATAKFELANVTTITQAAGAELRVIDSDSSTLLSIVFLADGQEIAGGTITGAAAGNASNYIVASATQIYVLEGGAAAGSNDSITAVGENIKEAVTAWNAIYGDMVTCANAAGVLTWTMNKHRGADGNAAGGVAANGALTITGFVNRFGAGQTPLLGTGTEQWIKQPQGAKAATAFIPFGSAAGDLDGVVGDTPAADAAVEFTNAVTDGDHSNDVQLRIEADKYATAKIHIKVTVKTDVTTPRNGIAVAWSLTPA